MNSFKAYLSVSLSLLALVLLGVVLYSQQSREMENMLRQLSGMKQRLNRLKGDVNSLHEGNNVIERSVNELASQVAATDPPQTEEEEEEDKEEEKKPTPAPTPNFNARGEGWGHSQYRGDKKKDFPFISTAKANNVMVVPKVVHFIWLFDPKKCTLRFHQFLSMLSAHKFIRPDKIIIWKTFEPCGKWWLELKRKVPELEMHTVEVPQEIYGHKMNVIEHKSDIIRINTILQYGGIYLDTDIIVLRPWDPLLYYNTTMGSEYPEALGSGIIISAPRMNFIKMWLESYKTFDDSQWAVHATLKPMQIARQHPDLIHIEWDTLHRPAWYEPDWLYKPGKLWDWSSNYGIHLWYRLHKVEHNPEDIKTINTTMGELFRHVYYDHPGIMT